MAAIHENSIVKNRERLFGSELADADFRDECPTSASSTRLQQRSARLQASGFSGRKLLGLRGTPLYKGQSRRDLWLGRRRAKEFGSPGQGRRRGDTLKHHAFPPSVPATGRGGCHIAGVLALGPGSNLSDSTGAGNRSVWTGRPD